MKIAESIVNDGLTSFEVLPVLTIIEHRCKEDIMDDILEYDSEPIVLQKKVVHKKFTSIQDLLDHLKNEDIGSGNESSLN